MESTRRRLLRTIAATGAVGTVAGCLEQIQRAQPETTAEPMPTDSPTPDSTDGGIDADYTVGVSEHPEHGEILVDSAGMTLYLFTQDKPGESVCYDSCAENWPPLTVEGSPTAKSELPGTLGTTDRQDGTSQVTYNEWPLYYWVQDQQPGDATGHGVNDVWFVVAPDQEPPEASEETTDGGSGNYGGDY